MINFANKLILDFENDSDRRISTICRALTVLTIVVILLNMLHVFIYIRLLLCRLSYC